MRRRTCISHSPEETFEIARRIGVRIRKPAVFLLTGELGAGKTVFAKGLAAGLGIDPREVSSPSFTLINEYRGRMKFVHADLYRLEGTDDEIRSIGLVDMLDRLESVVLIEWAERLASIPPEARKVIIAYGADDTSRVITVS